MVLSERYFWVLDILNGTQRCSTAGVLSEFNVSRFGTFVTSIVWVLNPCVLWMNMGRPSNSTIPSFMALAHWCRIFKSTEALLKIRFFLIFVAPRLVLWVLGCS